MRNWLVPELTDSRAFMPSDQASRFWSHAKGSHQKELFRGLQSKRIIRHFGQEADIRRRRTPYGPLPRQESFSRPRTECPFCTAAVRSEPKLADLAANQTRTICKKRT